MSELFGPSHQAAVVAVANGKLCLVTSSSGRRWTLPKGAVEDGQTEAESAGREAWEEAGLRGAVDPKPLLRYETYKWGRARTVTVFLMRVTATAEDWPERTVRERRWFSPVEAIANLVTVGQREAVRLAMETGLAVPAGN